MYEKGSPIPKKPECAKKLLYVFLKTYNGKLNVKEQKCKKRWFACLNWWTDFCKCILSYILSYINVKYWRYVIFLTSFWKHVSLQRRNIHKKMLKTSLLYVNCPTVYYSLCLVQQCHRLYACPSCATLPLSSAWTTKIKKCLFVN